MGLGHEKLDVYRLSIGYVAWVYEKAESLNGLHRSARDQWLRASQSIPLNIAEGNGKTSEADRRRYFEIARGSALECAAIQDVLVTGKALDNNESQNRKDDLDRMAAMLSRLGGRGYQVREDQMTYNFDPDSDSEKIKSQPETPKLATPKLPVPPTPNPKLPNSQLPHSQTHTLSLLNPKPRALIMENCLFCKIVRKEIPATVVYEDDDALVFMDIGPIIKGHLLVIPKKHYDPITDTPDEVLCRLIKLCKKGAAALQDGLGAQGVNLIQNNGPCAGQEVPHLHFHLIPRFENDGHHWNWAAKAYASAEEMSSFSEKIKAALLAPPA